MFWRKVFWREKKNDDGGAAAADAAAAAAARPPPPPPPRPPPRAPPAGDAGGSGAGQGEDGSVRTRKRRRAWRAAMTNRTRSPLWRPSQQAAGAARRRGAARPEHRAGRAQAVRGRRLAGRPRVRSARLLPGCGTEPAASTGAPLGHQLTDAEICAWPSRPCSTRPSLPYRCTRARREPRPPAGSCSMWRRPPLCTTYGPRARCCRWPSGVPDARQSTSALDRAGAGGRRARDGGRAGRVHGVFDLPGHGPPARAVQHRYGEAAASSRTAPGG